MKSGKPGGRCGCRERRACARLRVLQDARAADLPGQAARPRPVHHLPRDRAAAAVRVTEGVTGWNEEQSRQNFEAWQRVVVPGDPNASRLLMHPLAKSAGGDPFHAGGKHWQSRDGSRMADARRLGSRARRHRTSSR